jgi:hypothetical protein
VVLTVARKLTTTTKGYGWEHQRLRKIWAARVARGGVPCARCGLPIEVGEPFDLGHRDDVPGKRAYQGAEHRYCSRRAGQRKAQLNRRSQRRTSRSW